MKVKRNNAQIIARKPKRFLDYFRTLRLTAWLGVGIQFTLMIIGTFTPIPVSAWASEQVLVGETYLSIAQTRTYTLSYGENVESVAKKYNITLEELRQLNQFRSFSNGFDNLRKGDEIEVPLAPLPTVSKHNDSNNNQEEQKHHELAQTVIQTGQFLNATPNTDNSLSTAREIAAVKISNEVEKFLNHFGTARIQLNTNEDLSLKNSNFDLLIPLYEPKDKILFSQTSIHRSSERNQANIGFGYRLFNDNWMIGSNTFLDYDLSRDHARIGIGGEYWRDFIKLGGNAYQRLTNWKTSPDVTGYEERPANGWDVQAQGWLPKIPQLGGKLAIEQYYGQDVGLFGKENRQRNPYAITAGLSYTPIPLLMLSAEQKQGKSGRNETRLNIEMNYRLSMPWQSQISSDSVQTLRNLAGSRYDLIERSNNIILEYRKKELIQLNAAAVIAGNSKDQKSMDVSVTSRYGIDRIDWTAPDLLSAGGNIVKIGAEYYVILPEWKMSDQNGNNYKIQGVAVDKKGNTSNRTETQVTVLQPEINKNYSTFTPLESMLPADGTSTQLLVLTLRDYQQQLIDVAVSEINVVSTATDNSTVSALTKASKGVYELTVTAGKHAETINITPEIHGTSLASARVNITEMKPVQLKSKIETDKKSYTVGDDIIVKVFLSDTSNNAVPGMTDLLTNSVIDVSYANLKYGERWKDNNDGSYTAVYVANLDGRGLTAKIKFEGLHEGAESEQYTIAHQPTPANSTVRIDKAIYAIGDEMVITVLLKNSNDIPVKGVSRFLVGMVNVENAIDDSNAWNNWTDNDDGSYTARYTATTAGSKLKVTMQLEDWDEKTSSEFYEVIN
ncbi:invasin [Enterobacteriaceae bacterium 89]|nr:invasin [Enterobacteriaceae bacterium 89]